MQVNIADAKRDLSKLIRLLENNREESITVAKNGHPIVKMTLIEQQPVSNRIGIAKGKFKAPDDFDATNDEIAKMLMGD